MWTIEQKKLLETWINRIQKEALEYKYYGIVYSRNYYAIGIASVSLLALFGTTGFVGISVCPYEDPECEAKKIIDWINVSFDLMASILLTINTFLNFGGHAEKCRVRKIELDALARTIEESITFTEELNIDKETWIKNISSQYNEIQKKQIVLGTSWLSKNDIVKLNPLDQITFSEKSSEFKSTENIIFQRKYVNNKIFNNNENEYQLNRLNDSIV